MKLFRNGIVLLSMFFMVGSTTSYAYGCLQSLDEEVSCTLSSVNPFIAFDHGAIEISHKKFIQDPNSHRTCNRSPEYFGATVELNSQSDTADNGVRSYAIDISRDEQSGTFSLINLQVGAHMLFLGYDEKTQEPNYWGAIQAASGQFSYQKASQQEITLKMDGIDLRFTARCVPRQMRAMMLLNQCIDKLTNKRDSQQQCAKQVIAGESL